MRLLKNMLAVTTAIAAIGYDTKAGWKKAADGSLETDGDGNPILLDADGKETVLAPGYINRLNTESAGHRAAARAAEAKVAAFGDLDPVAAKAAVEKLKDVDLSKMIDKGELETVKAQMREQSEKELRETTEKLTATEQRLNAVTLNSALGSSKFLNERLAVPADAAMAVYRDRFKVEDGKVVPLNERGEPLFNKHGEVASVDEALETYIGSRADKDNWIKAPEVGGSGSQGGGGGRGGGNTMKRAEFDALPEMQRAALGAKMAKGEIQVVD